MQYQTVLYCGKMNITDTELAEIVKKCKKGDQTAYSLMVDLFSRKLYGYFYRLTGNKDISSDLLSELFLKLVKNIKKFKNGSFESWIYRIASNVFNDYLRKKQRTGKLTEAYTHHLQQQNTERPPNENIINDKLQMALNKMNDDERQIITLKYQAELSFKEIAKLRQEPIGTTLSKMHRCLKKLRNLMAE